MSGYTLNTAGGGARPDRDGVDAYGFPLGHYGKAPDLEDVETEYPFLHLFQHFRLDSGGMGRQRGGAGTETAWMVHLAPRFVFQSVASHSRIPTSSGLFGGYPAAVRPGIQVLHGDLARRLAAGDSIPDTTPALVDPSATGGEVVIGPGIRSSRIHDSGDVYVGLTPGGAGYGDVLDRDAQAVVDDVRRGVISTWSAREVWKVVFDDATLVVDAEATEALRRAERLERVARGRPYDEFVAEWSQRQPPQEVLEYFGAWPSGEKTREIIRI
jgi:acetophenone carboxylase